MHWIYQVLTALQTLTFKLMPKIDDSLKADVVRWAAFYEHRIRNGSVSTLTEPSMSGRAVH